MPGRPSYSPAFFCSAKTGMACVRHQRSLAERVGFEPTVRCRTAVFKTASLNHSDISPCGHPPYAVSNAYLIYQICTPVSSLWRNFFLSALKNKIYHNLFGSWPVSGLYKYTFLLYNKHKKISSRCKGEIYHVVFRTFEAVPQKAGHQPG